MVIIQFIFQLALSLCWTRSWGNGQGKTSDWAMLAFLRWPCPEGFLYWNREDFHPESCCFARTHIQNSNQFLQIIYRMAQFPLGNEHTASLQSRFRNSQRSRRLRVFVLWCLDGIWFGNLSQKGACRILARWFLINITFKRSVAYLPIHRDKLKGGCSDTQGILGLHCMKNHTECSIPCHLKESIKILLYIQRLLFLLC